MSRRARHYASPQRGIGRKLMEAGLGIIIALGVALIALSIGMFIGLRLWE